MNCYKCATPLPDDARFCLSCGADVSGEHTHERTLAVEADPELLAKLQTDIGGEYIIEKELGRGGMAIVFLGHDAHLGRKVAVKLLPPELTFGAGSSVIERFRREARTAATLDHPNIIPVYRVSQSGKLFWYVMKYLEGEALDDILEREGQLAVDRCADILRQVADALDYAHQHQVIHRDIKPANIMLDARGRVTVTDFGIAKALDANTLTASGAMIGTPYYMSPEQCSGKRVGPPSDQYSLAVMTYQMLGGHLPFTGDSVVDIIRKHVMDPVPPLGVLRPGLPKPVVQVVERGLAKHPEERFASCAEFARALGQAAQGLDITAAPPHQPAGVRMSKTALVSPVPGALRTAKGAWRDRRALLVGAGIVAAAGAFAIGALIARGRSGLGAGGTRLDTTGIPPGTQLADAVRARPRADSTAAVSNPVAAAAPPPSSAVPARAARLTLSGVPAGATVTRDGRTVRGNAMDLVPGQRHIVTVIKPGFQPWADTLRPTEGQQIAATVVTRPAGATPLTQTGPAGQQPAVQPPANPPSAAAPPPATGPAFITIGSRPSSAMTINGRPVTNPVSNFEVPAGTVRVHFQVTDSTGVWTVDAEYTMTPGEHRNIGRVQLRHP